MGDAFDPNPQGGTDPANVVGQNAVRAIYDVAQAVRETFPNWVDVPGSASASGTAGQVAYSTTHFYLCVQANTWKRVAVSTF